MAWREDLSAPLSADELMSDDKLEAGRQIVEDMLARMSGRERLVVVSRFGLTGEEPMTLREVYKASKSPEMVVFCTFGLASVLIGFRLEEKFTSCFCGVFLQKPCRLAKLRLLLGKMRFAPSQFDDLSQS